MTHKDSNDRIVVDIFKMTTASGTSSKISRSRMLRFDNRFVQLYLDALYVFGMRKPPSQNIDLAKNLEYKFANDDDDSRAQSQVNDRSSTNYI